MKIKHEQEEKKKNLSSNEEFKKPISNSSKKVTSDRKDYLLNSKKYQDM